MDKLKYDYKELDRPNVLLAYEKGTTAPPVSSFSADRYTLIYTVAKKKPSWSVVVYRGSNLIEIYEGNEKLGSVSTHPYRAGNPFLIKTPRVKVRRGEGTTTKDPKKAASIILKTFAKVTLPEMLEKAARAAQEKVYQANNKAMNEESSAHQYVIKNLTSFFRDNWQMVEAAALSNTNNKAEHEQISSYPKKMEARVESAVMTAQLGLGKGNVVCIKDKQYYVCNKGGALQETYIDDTLPPYYKRAVGMLKLVAPGEFVPTYGVRAAESVFFICEEK